MSHVIIIVSDGIGPGGSAKSRVEYTPDHAVPPVLPSWAVPRPSVYDPQARFDKRDSDTPGSRLAWPTRKASGVRVAGPGLGTGPGQFQSRGTEAPSGKDRV